MQQFQGSGISSEKVTLDIHCSNISSGVGFALKCGKSVLDIQLKITNCEVVVIKIKMSKESLGNQ